MDWLLADIPVIDVPWLLAAGIAALWLLLRNRATEFGSSSDLETMIGGGEPLVLEFFGKL